MLFFFVAIMVIAGISFSGKNVVTAQTCQGDLQGLIKQCAQYVQKPGPIVQPSQGCCSIVKNVDVPCICKYITKDVEKIISMEKVVYVARFCGQAISSGTKCGSKKY